MSHLSKPVQALLLLFETMLCESAVLVVSMVGIVVSLCLKTYQGIGENGGWPVEVYKINIPMFIFGFCIFAFVYMFLWNRILKGVIESLMDISKWWLIGFGIVSAAMLVLMFPANLAANVLAIGLFATYGEVAEDITLFGPIALAVVLPVIQWAVTKKKA